MNLLGRYMGTGDIDAIILGGNGYRLQILKIKDGAMESDVELIIGTLISELSGQLLYPLLERLFAMVKGTVFFDKLIVNKDFG